VNDFNRSLMLVVLLVILLPVLWGTVMMGAMGGGMVHDGWGGWDGWSPWQGFLAMLSTLLVIGGIAALVWWAFGRPGGAGPSGPGASPRGEGDARAILDARYARGELTREQYQQMRSDLES